MKKREYFEWNFNNNSMHSKKHFQFLFHWIFFVSNEGRNFREKIYIADLVKAVLQLKEIIVNVVVKEDYEILSGWIIDIGIRLLKTF